MLLHSSKDSACTNPGLAYIYNCFRDLEVVTHGGLSLEPPCCLARLMGRTGNSEKVELIILALQMASHGEMV